MPENEDFPNLLLLSSLDDPVALKALIEAGASMKPDALSAMPLLHTVARKYSSEILRLILDAGGSKYINDFDQMALTPLSYAAAAGKLDSVRLLIERGCDVNAHDEPRAGNTALRHSVDSVDVEMIRILVEAGADPAIPGWMHLTALDVAQKRVEENSDAESKAIMSYLRSRQ